MAKKPITRYVPMIAGVTFITAVAIAVIVGIQTLLDKPASTKKFVQQVSLIKPPPPPPKIEKPPEPEIEEEVKIDEPEPAPDDMSDALDDLPPMGDQLGLDGDGVAGSDGFGLIGKKGGRSLLGGNGGSEFSWYTSRLGSYIEKVLYDLSEKEEIFKTIRKADYKVKVKIWIDQDLSIRGKLIESTGDAQRDRAIRLALGKLGKYNEPVPGDMAQPVRIAIVSRL